MLWLLRNDWRAPLKQDSRLCCRSGQYRAHQRLSSARLSGGLLQRSRRTVGGTALAPPSNDSLYPPFRKAGNPSARGCRNQPLLSVYVVKLKSALRACRWRPRGHGGISSVSSHQCRRFGQRSLHQCPPSCSSEKNTWTPKPPKNFWPASLEHCFV